MIFLRRFCVLLTLLTIVSFMSPASALTVQLNPGLTSQTVDPDSIGMDVTYDMSVPIGTSGQLSFGLVDTGNVGSLSMNVGATTLSGSTWQYLELVTFAVDPFSGMQNFMNTTGLLDVSTINSGGGYIWDLNFSQVRDQSYLALFTNSTGAPATGGFFGITGVDSQTVVSPPPSPSPVPLPAGVWLLLSGLIFLFRQKIFVPIRRLFGREYSPSRIPRVARKKPATWIPMPKMMMVRT